MTTAPHNLAQWLQFIDAGHSAEIDLGLSRIQPVADRLGLLAPWAMPIITIAGTNGKGSTVALMRALAAANGLRVGCYTSPHFQAYNERVNIAGVDVSDEQLCRAFTAVEAERNAVGVTLTYFEYGTLAALWLFRQHPLDLLLLEVGLGGRLDAVNLIDSDVAVVTTVALDHQSWLGNDRESIGREKAGICRPGKPLVYGERDMPQSVAAVCREQQAPVLRWGTDFAPQKQANSWSWFGVDAQGQALEFGGLPLPQLPLPNAATAIQALLLAGVELNAAAICTGIESARLTGRMQQVYLQGRELLLDVAHNPHAAEYLATRLREVAGRRWCVVGMLADKDIPATLQALIGRIDHWLPVGLEVPRGASVEVLAEQLAEQSLTPQSDVAAALEWALARSQVGDQILITGSFYTVAAALDWIAERTDGVG
ncbi:MAG TPA: bifunctional tetrahydrofolate synthase/dihydrofolate synthase [Motiliproteus sp.]